MYYCKTKKYYKNLSTMEIQDIKIQLSLSQVLHHYNLQPKNNMLRCPFHDDKTASLQVNLAKNYYKCYACGAKGDQIQWVQDFEKLTKHEALLGFSKILMGKFTSKKWSSQIL
jgi:DNA primase